MMDIIISKSDHFEMVVLGQIPLNSILNPLYTQHRMSAEVGLRLIPYSTRILMNVVLLSTRKQLYEQVYDQHC